MFTVYLPSLPCLLPLHESLLFYSFTISHSFSSSYLLLSNQSSNSDSFPPHFCCNSFMTKLFRSMSDRIYNAHYVFDEMPPSPNSVYLSNEDEEDDEDEEKDEEYYSANNPITTPFISPDRRQETQNSNQFPLLAVLVAAFRKSIVTCGVENDDDVTSSIDIGSPTNVRHVSHVTFDRFNGFLGLPLELQPDVPRKVPSASASVFGVSAKSMQCSYDQSGNSVPTILLMMQEHLYSQGGLKAEGIFRITGETGREEYVRKQLNKGFVPNEIDVHCLAGLIKAWFRELPTGILDSLRPEEVMQCNSEEDCAELAKSLPQTEASLLNWAINLMADVAYYEYYNKMNARNIAMVFAPNMTQMADPLTALLHAVQVMNFLKTLIEKTLQERESNSPRCSYSPPNNFTNCKTPLLEVPKADSSGSFWSVPSKNEGESISRSPVTYKETSMEVEGFRDKLNFRKSVRKLCSHPMFQLSRPVKKTTGIEIVNT